MLVRIVSVELNEELNQCSQFQASRRARGFLPLWHARAPRTVPVSLRRERQHRRRRQPARLDQEGQRHLHRQPCRRRFESIYG